MGGLSGAACVLGGASPTGRGQLDDLLGVWQLWPLPRVSWDSRFQLFRCESHLVRVWLRDSVTMAERDALLRSHTSRPLAAGPLGCRPATRQ